jgi:hypothetical protein
MYALPGYKYDRPFLDSFTPGLIFITTFRSVLESHPTTLFPRLHFNFCHTFACRHPVQEFLDAWVKLGMRARMRLAAKDNSLDLVDFLKAPDKHLQAVSTVSFRDDKCSRRPRGPEADCIGLTLLVVFSQTLMLATIFWIVRRDGLGCLTPNINRRMTPT